MATVEVNVLVSKETYELGQGIVALAKAVLQAKLDGWQTGQDFPAIIAAAFANLEAFQGVELIQQELQADPAAFGKALALSVSDLYGALKPVEAPSA